MRFGSAEIYNVIEAFFGDDIQDSICVGQRRPLDHDESVVLFLLMKPGKRFSEALVKEVKQRIGKECSPRHVPKYVFETPEIPVSLPLKSLRYIRNADGMKITDDGQSQESGIASQEDCFWRKSHSVRNSAQSTESGVLLQVCQGGGVGRWCQE